MMIILFLGLLISILLISLNNLISPTPPIQNEKISAFECGFDPLCTPRKPFSTRYFLLILIFLVFDVEAVLLLPILSKVMIYPTPQVLLTLYLFLMILLVGLLVEWYSGALDWA